MIRFLFFVFLLVCCMTLNLESDFGWYCYRMDLVTGGYVYSIGGRRDFRPATGVEWHDPDF